MKIKDAYNYDNLLAQYDKLHNLHVSLEDM